MKALVTGMKRSRGRGGRGRRGGPRARVGLSLLLALSLLLGGCFEREEGETFYGRVSVPRAQEFRWSDGGLPRVFDPARAAAPPDTDAVRALFEGLTEYEPGTVRPAPAVASRWESHEGGRVWTFHLRRGARWSNGDAVTAQDFVRSWRRTIRLGERAPHVKLLANIEGAQEAPEAATVEYEASVRAPQARDEGRAATAASPEPKRVEFGAVALDAHTLKVTLQRPDRNFASLVAHPVFRPVHELSLSGELGLLQEEELNRREGDAGFGVVTNGAFALSRLGGDSVVLERAESYWDASSVKLERVYFVNKPDTEEALTAYRAGELDAVTNAAFEPLAVKLLTPYKDFRRETFAALNYYHFNASRPPFDDRRVREALALALDLERLSRDTLGGATEPARKFIPFDIEDGGSQVSQDGEGEAVEPAAQPLSQNVERARKLLAEAGYPGGENFPRVRLLINRNDQQRQIASAVARMWRDALGVQTELVVRDWEEYEMMLRAGDYDLARRSLVMQAADSETNMIALFGDGSQAAPGPTQAASPTEAPGSSPDAQASPGTTPEVAAQAATPPVLAPVLTEAEALRELPAIPIYFASSYALVKPYVQGFESNLLDAPTLKHVQIETGWTDPKPKQSGGIVQSLLR